MDIGPPKRIIEVEPAALPVPETLPLPERVPEPAPLGEPGTPPRREPQPEPPAPARE